MRYLARRERNAGRSSLLGVLEVNQLFFSFLKKNSEFVSGTRSYASGLRLRAQAKDSRAPGHRGAQFEVLLRNTSHNIYAHAGGLVALLLRITNNSY